MFTNLQFPDPKMLKNRGFLEEKFEFEWSEIFQNKGFRGGVEVYTLTTVESTFFVADNTQ